MRPIRHIRSIGTSSFAAGGFAGPASLAPVLGALIDSRKAVVQGNGRLTRLCRGPLIAVVLALAVAAPAAAATTPTRTVYGLSQFELPAGTACTFGVEGLPSRGFTAVTQFSDGRVMSSVRAHGTYVNPASGASFPTADNFRAIDQVDPVTGIDVGAWDGQVTSWFLPGDQGPFGVVGPGPAMYHFVGSVSYKWDTVANRMIQFTYSGTVTDVCAALS